MKPTILYAILLSVSATGFIAWRVRAVKMSDPPQYEIVEDASGSHGRVCGSLQGLAEQNLESPEAAAGSTLTVLVLGDRSTANEPRWLGSYPIPTIRRVAEGSHEISRQRADVLADLHKRCQSLTQAAVSPIYLGVKQAVADLRGSGCNARSQCRLFVDSDLEENVETSIRRNLHPTGGGTPSLPPVIENAGINVVFCGLAIAVGHIVGPSGYEIGAVAPRNAVQEDRLRRTWKALFAKSEAVTFEPYCPVHEAP